MKKILCLFFLISLFKQGWSQEWLAAKSFGTCDGDIFFHTVHPTSDGYIIAGNVYAPSIKMDSFNINIQGEQGAVIAGLNHQLSVQWAFSMSAQGIIVFYHITTDQSGNIYLAGSFSGLYFVLNQDTIYNLGNSDVVLIKLNAEREVVWVKHYSTPYNDGALSIICDSSNQIYFSWYTADFDGNSQQEIIKLNSSGAILWSKKIISGLSVSRMEITPDKRLLLAGTVQQGGVLSDGVQVSNPDEFNSVFLLFYDLEGNHIETHLIPEYALMHDLKFNQGELLILGWMKGVDQPVIDWISKYDAEYQIIWSKPLFSCSSELYNLDFSPEMQVTEDGTIIIAGGFMNEYVCFGDQTFYNIPINPDFPFSEISRTFLMEIDSTGEPLGIQFRGEELRNGSFRLVKGTDGNMLLLGFFQTPRLNFGEYDLINLCPLDTLVFPFHGHRCKLP
jgi:hypothetical protein